MRITQGMMNQNMLHNLQRNYEAMAKTNEQVSTGKKISRPSDDPVTAVRGMFYRSSLNEVDQYKRNASDGISWMTATDEALDEVTNVIHRVRELTVQAENGTNGETDKYAIAAEIRQIKAHLGEISNSQISGKYIFAGTDINRPPYRDETGVPGFMNQNTESIDVQLGQTNHIPINVSGTDVFNHGGVGGLFKVLDDLAAKFEGTGPANGAGLDQLDEQLDNILKVRADLGARMNRMELSLSRIEGLEISTTTQLSDEENVDLSRAIIDLKSQENVQKAALSIGASIIQTSLVDFLR